MGKYCLCLIIIMLAGPRDANSQDRMEEARLLYLAAESAREAGDFALATEKLRLILEGDYPLPVLNLAVLHNALGLVSYELGRLDRAKEHYELAESYCLRAGPSSRRIQVNIWNNMALRFNALGDYTAAMGYFGRAARLLDSLPDQEPSYYHLLSSLQLNQGIALYRLGRLEESEAILLESSKIKDRYDLSFRGSVYFNLARISRDKGDLQAAESWYRKSIDRWIAEHDTGYYQLANNYLEMGRLLANRNRPGEVEEYLELALRIYRVNYGEFHYLTAQCYEQLASYSLGTGDYRHSLELIGRALVSIAPGYRSTGIMDNPGTGSSLHDLTFLKILATRAEILEYAAGGQQKDDRKKEYLQAALSANRRSIEVLYKLQNSFISSESRTYLLARQKELFATGIRLNIAMQELTSDPFFLEEAFLAAASGKANDLMYEMKLKEWLYLETLPDSAARIVLSLKQLSEYYSNLIESESEDPAPDTVRLVKWQEQLFQYRDSFARQMDLLRTDHASIARFDLPREELSMEKVRKNLDRGESLVEYFISGSDKQKELHIFVVTKRGCNHFQGRLDTSFQSHLDVLGNRLYGFVPFDENRSTWKELEKSLFELYRLLIRPVEDHFTGDALVIVPDEQLAMVPFDALVRSHDPGLHGDYTGASYLVHRYHISYLVNSGLTATEGHRKPLFPGVIAINPTYRRTSSERGLPGASLEVAEILDLAKGRELAGNLDKDQVIHSMQQRAIIHMAMHARSGEEKNESPHFYFPGSGDSLHANRIYDFEISMLKLSTPLVVLSSCESAAGKLVPGEGIISLSRSFLQAGATSVVHSLWKVEDLKGSGLMPLYYRQLKKGIRNNRSLTAAKREFLSLGIPAFNHPYYWSAYQLTGNTSSLAARPGQPLLVLVAMLLLIPVSYRVIRRIFFPNS